jgi:hypothetical protein
MAQVGVVKQGGATRQAAARRAPAELIRPLVAGLVVLIALLGIVGTAVRGLKPHDIPVGVVGPSAAIERLSTAFGSAAPGVFAFTAYGSEDSARAALDSRSVDAVLVLTPPAPRLIVAGAAGDGVTGVITGAFTDAFKAQGVTVAVETAHPFASGDPHGLILFFVVLAVVVSSFISQAVAVLGRSSSPLLARLAVLALFSALAALAAMGTAAWLADGYGSGFWTATGLVALAAAAVGAVVAGLGRLLGVAGVGVAGLVVILLNLVTSGGPAGSQLLPDFYRWLAPWMPAGQLYTGLTGALYFDGAALQRPVLVLGAWLLGGLVLMLLGELVGRRSGAEPAAAPAR